MPAKKFLRLVAGVFTEVAATVTSAGAGNDGDLVALDSSGRLDNSVMPVGIGVDTKTIAASEALATGDWVNVWNGTGAKVRKADATTAGKEAHGFVLAAVSSGGNALVYFEGTNTQVTAQVPGPVFLSTTPGKGGNTPAAAPGNLVQSLGVATSATSMNFEPAAPIKLA